MDGLMWFVDMEASFDQSYIVVIRKFRYLQNKGTSLWNFFLNSELKKFQIVINWTIIR